MGSSAGPACLLRNPDSLLFLKKSWFCNNFFVLACQCNLDGTVHDHDDEDDEHDHHGEVASCDANGQCACKDNYTGDKCDHCAPDHYNIANTCHRMNLF